MAETLTIALVGNAPVEKHEMLNALLSEDALTEMYDISLYGTDGQHDTEAFLDALADCREGQVDGVVCLPLSTSPRKIAASSKASEQIMPIMINSICRMAAVKGHVSANEAASTLSKENVIERTTQLYKALKRDLLIQNPRIAITSLNSDISTVEGSAEINIIAPAVSELVNSGIQAFGPVASSKLFEGNDFMAFDAVLQMYDGQLNDVFREIAPDGSVTLFTGTEVPVTQAEPDQLFHAITLAGDVMRNRKEYDLPFSNPLQKLYREKKEDGDKARFAVKKKGFNPAEHRRENVTYVKEENKSNS